MTIPPWLQTGPDAPEAYGNLVLIGAVGLVVLVVALMNVLERRRERRDRRRHH